MLDIETSETATEAQSNTEVDENDDVTTEMENMTTEYPSGFEVEFTTISSVEIGQPTEYTEYDDYEVVTILADDIIEEDTIETTIVSETDEKEDAKNSSMLHSTDHNNTVLISNATVSTTQLMNNGSVHEIAQDTNNASILYDTESSASALNITIEEDSSKSPNNTTVTTSSQQQANVTLIDIESNGKPILADMEEKGKLNETGQVAADSEEQDKESAIAIDQEVPQNNTSTNLNDISTKPDTNTDILSITVELEEASKPTNTVGIEQNLTQDTTEATTILEDTSVVISIDATTISTAPVQGSINGQPIQELSTTTTESHYNPPSDVQDQDLKPLGTSNIMNQGQLSGQGASTFANQGQLPGQGASSLVNQGQLSGQGASSLVNQGQPSGQEASSLENQGQVSGQSTSNFMGQDQLFIPGPLGQASTYPASTLQPPGKPTNAG